MHKCYLLGQLFIIYNVYSNCNPLSAAVELLFFAAASALLLQAALAAPLQGMPLAAPLLLWIMGRTIVCSAVLPLPRLKLAT